MAKAEAKIAIVTGASGGSDRASATRLAKDGFSVVLGYSGSADKAEQVVNEIKAAADQAMAMKADLNKPDEVASLFERSLSKLGQINVVVHSAGIMPLSPIIKSDVKQFDEVITINLRGSFLVLAQAAQHVADGGRIMALSSSVIGKSTPTYGAYIASKAGVEGLVKVLAAEVRGAPH